MFRKSTLSFLFLILSLTCAVAGTAGISLRADTDKKQITIGDRLALTLTCAAPRGWQVSEPEKIAELGPWTVKDIRADRSRAADGETVNIVYTLTTFTTGQVTIPPVAVKYTGTAAGEDQTLSEPVTIMVASVLPANGPADDIRDIKPPLSLPVPPWVYLAWLTAIAGAAAGFWFWYRRYRLRPSAALPVPATPPVPPYQAAMDALERLKESGLVAEGRVKEFYIALSEIIRDYIAAIYSLEVRDKTTAELYAELRSREPDRKILGAIKDFFDECDFVKFAKYRPDETICWRDWEEARRIVEG